MTTRRMLVLVAILMGLTAIAAGLAAPPSGPRRDGARGDGATAVPDPRPASDIVERTVRLSEPSTVAVDEGDLVRLTVRGRELDTVELVGLDLLAPIAPETPAVFDVLADEPGRYRIRLLDAGRDAGALRVIPARE